MLLSAPSTRGPWHTYERDRTTERTPQGLLVHLLGRARRTRVVLRHAHRAGALHDGGAPLQARGRRGHHARVHRGLVPDAPARRLPRRPGARPVQDHPLLLGPLRARAHHPRGAGDAHRPVHRARPARARLRVHQAQHQHADGPDVRGAEEGRPPHRGVQLLLRRHQHRLRPRHADPPQGPRLRARPHRQPGARLCGGADDPRRPDGGGPPRRRSRRRRSAPP